MRMAVQLIHTRVYPGDRNIGIRRKPFNCAFGATWLKPGMNEIRYANSEHAVLIWRIGRRLHADVPQLSNLLALKSEDVNHSNLRLVRPV